MPDVTAFSVSADPFLTVASCIPRVTGHDLSPSPTVFGWLPPTNPLQSDRSLPAAGKQLDSLYNAGAMLLHGVFIYYVSVYPFPITFPSGEWRITKNRHILGAGFRVLIFHLSL